jgi:hypothetical protein
LHGRLTPGAGSTQEKDTPGTASERRKLRRTPLVAGRHLQADQDAAVVGALVAVVEQADVPARVHGGQEAHQRARPLGELEAEEALVARQLAAPADHVPHMLLGQFVVGQVDGGEAVPREVARDALGLARAG